jgi:hypothetical protein
MVSFALKSDLYYTPHAGLTWLIDECPPCMVPANDEHTKPYASHRLVSGVLFTFDRKGRVSQNDETLQWSPLDRASVASEE